MINYRQIWNNMERKKGRLDSSKAYGIFSPYINVISLVVGPLVGVIAAKETVDYFILGLILTLLFGFVITFLVVVLRRPELFYDQEYRLEAKKLDLIQKGGDKEELVKQDLKSLDDLNV